MFQALRSIARAKDNQPNTQNTYGKTTMINNYQPWRSVLWIRVRVQTIGFNAEAGSKA